VLLCVERREVEPVLTMQETLSSLRSYALSLLSAFGLWMLLMYQFAIIGRARFAHYCENVPLFIRVPSSNCARVVWVPGSSTRSLRMSAQQRLTVSRFSSILGCVLAEALGISFWEVEMAWWMALSATVLRVWWVPSVVFKQRSVSLFCLTVVDAAAVR
jgi:hypothetical protein